MYLKMKNSKPWFFLFLMLFCSSAVYSQTITTGVFSGVNFSDIRGQDFGGKWKSKQGPVQGFYLGWLLNKSLGIQTGINFSTVYYEHVSSSPSGIYYPIDFNIIGPEYYYQVVSKMDFSFIRVPILFTVQVPSVIQFNMRAGLIFSFLKDHSLNSDYYYYPEPGIAKKTDFGYMFSSGISYPITNNIKVSFNANYITGRKHLLESSNLKQGSSEFVLGIDYEFLKKNKKPVNQAVAIDSTSKKVAVTYWGGVDISWNGLDLDRSKYSTSAGPSLGFSVKFLMDPGLSLISGVSFERKGYSMKDSSASFFTYLNNGTPRYFVDAKVQIDYIVIPLLMNLSFGKSQMVFFNTGPWLGLKLNARNVGNAYNESRSESNYMVSKTVIYDDLERYIKNYDVGWIFGTGISVPFLKKYKVDLALRYSTGFKNVFNQAIVAEQQGSSIADYEIRNRTISFHIGITLPQSGH
jgi:opacity protein-like surface antigen